MRGYALPALVERISAVSAGSDKVAKVLHARYGRRRVEALDAESDGLARAGTPVGAEAAQEHRLLRDAVSGLEEQLKDPKRAEREKALKEATAQSRRVALAARRRLSDVDRSAAEAARRANREQTMSTF